MKDVCIGNRVREAVGTTWNIIFEVPRVGKTITESKKSDHKSSSIATRPYCRTRIFALHWEKNGQLLQGIQRFSSVGPKKA